MIQPPNESVRSQLLRLTPSGDLMDLARRLRELGVESLLICRPSGRIEQIVSDRQIAQMAMPEVESPVLGWTTPPDLPHSRRPEDDLLPAKASRLSPKGTITRT